jgi:hypothetical protein
MESLHLSSNLGTHKLYVFQFCFFIDSVLQFIMIFLYDVEAKQSFEDSLEHSCASAPGGKVYRSSKMKPA